MSAPFSPRNKKSSPSDAELAAVIEAILAEDPGVRRLNRKLRRAQERLRKLCSDRAWAAYLAVEAETSARADHIAHVLLRHGLTVAKHKPESPR